MNTMLETPSRVWRRIENIEGEDMPSLPSFPAFDESREHHTEETESTDILVDVSGQSNPVTSTPAAFSSHSISTVRHPPSAASTARFAHSIASRSTKSGMSNSRASVCKQTAIPPKDYSFDISAIPSLPNAREDLDIRSSDQDTSSRGSSNGEPHLPPMDPDTDDDDDEFDLSDALQSMSRSASPIPVPEPTPRKKYDYSVSLKSEPKPSPFDKHRNVSLRRPVSRNIRTPSLTHTNTPSPTSSTSHSTPRSPSSFYQALSNVASPISALAIPLPRSATASPMPVSRAPSASPMPARFVPLPSSANNSPVITFSPRINVSPTAYDGRGTVEPPALPAEPSLPASYTHEDFESETDEQDQGEREPTFTSEETFTPANHILADSGRDVSHEPMSPPPPSSAFSSPTPSALLTPTPAFNPRPRARFNVQPVQQRSTTPAHQNEVQEEEGPEDHTVQQVDVAAPHTTHKRSFLMSVINSTARPRLRQFPVRTGDVAATPGPNLQNAFAGITPGPRQVARRRMSHPLSQGWTAPPESGSGSESPGGYDGAVDRASFLSTASSQDLAIHARANASFDPVMGLGERGHGIGRFNAGKLNNYLHGLNRKLQEENESLVAQMRALEERLGKVEGTAGYDEPIQTQHMAHRRSSAGRRISAGPLGLNDVVEDVAEAWIEEKLELEDMVEDLRDQLGKVMAEKLGAMRERDAVMSDLEEERAGRVRDKDKWRERMGEVERGVEQIVDDLYQKLQASEDRAQVAEKAKAQTIKDVERRLAEVVVERDVLAERIEKAEDALQDGQDLGGAVNAANGRVSQVLSDLKNANLHINELEDELTQADQRAEALDRELSEEKKLVTELEDELQVKSDELSETLERISSLERDLGSTRDELEQEKAGAAELERAGDAAVDRIESLEQQLSSAQNKMETLMTVLDQERERASRLEIDAERNLELARQTEEALDEAEAKMRSDEEALGALRAKILALERELDKSRIEPSQFNVDPDAQEDIAALEAELDDAHREVARLNAILSQSPARKAIDKAKDAKIEMLEQERDDLLERLQSLKNSTVGTPGKYGSTSGISPMHRHALAMSFKSPKTPGAPLRDLSWLQTTMHDATAAPLVAEISRLQYELQLANESIDEKLDRLEDAGIGAVSLTNQLEDARTKIIALEDEIGRLSRREERRTQRLEKLRCQKCRAKVDVRSLQQRPVGDDSSFVDPADLSMPSEPPTPPTKTSERLRADLQSVNRQLAGMKQQWDNEKRKLLGENASLKDATSRLNAEVRHAKDEIKRFAETEREKVSTQGELDRAKRMVEDLESQLKLERSRLRGLTTEQGKVERQKEEVVLQLRRTESDMADIREELQRIKHENHELEGELRANSNVDQKARLLESRVAENAGTIEQLRRERSLLVANHKQLQKKFSEFSQNVSKLREQHAASQTSHDQRRHQLDLQLLEIDDLRRALSTQADELQRVEEEKNRAASEKTDMARSVVSLEADLRRVKRDAEAFGRDLRQLRSQKERLEADRKEEVAKADRAQKQSQTQIRLLKEEAREEREKCRALETEWKSHVCATSDGSAQLIAVAARHKLECKGLVTNITYLKAKWTRENKFRSDLCNQKQYLLTLLSKTERKEEKILSMIAKIGFPKAAPLASAPVRRKRTLKSVVLSVQFLLRVKRSKQEWQDKRDVKQTILAALEDVRKNRPKKQNKGKQRALS